MTKVYPSVCLLAFVVASAAHAPTLRFSRDLQHSNDEHALTAHSLAHNAAIHSDFASPTAFDAELAALPRNLAEDDDLKRFLLDDFYLPTLDVSVPPLFNWSDGDRTYLASLDESIDAAALLDQWSAVSFDPFTPIYGNLPTQDDFPQTTPVQVPTPGSFGLFAVGLAGLSFSGRKKKQKRLAAS